MDIGHLILLLFCIIAGCAVILGLYYIERKYPQKEKKKDAVFRAAVITAAFIALIAFLNILAGTEDFWLGEHWYIILIIFAVTWLMYMAHIFLFGKINYYKLRKIAIEYLKFEYNITEAEYKESIRLQKYIIIKEGKQTEAEEIAYFIFKLETTREQLREFFIGLNAYSRVPINIDPIVSNSIKEMLEARDKAIGTNILQQELTPEEEKN